MPIALQLLQEQPLIVTSYYGVVTADDYLECYRTIFESSDYRPTMHELADTRSMDAFDVQLPAIRAVAEMVAQAIGETAFLMRTAVIEGSAPNRSVSKLYGAVADLYQKETLCLFPALPPAAAWLDLPGSAIPIIERELALLNER